MFERVLVVLLLFLFGCSCHEKSNAALKTEVANLRKTVDDLKPGLGEIMGVIQQHHAKLYYAGSKENWLLAKYQLEEIQEGLDDVVKYYPTFKEVKIPLTKLVPMMTKSSLEQVAQSIAHKDKKEFAKAFDGLSISCTSCHQSADHPFIKILTPSVGMFSNQKFNP